APRRSHRKDDDATCLRDLDQDFAELTGSLSCQVASVRRHAAVTRTIMEPRWQRRWTQPWAIRDEPTCRAERGASTRLGRDRRERADDASLPNVGRERPRDDR